MSTIQYLTISADSVGQRLDNFLMTRLKGLPRSRLYRLIRKGEFRVNKKRTQPDYRLQLNDCIRIPPIKLSQPAAKTLPNARLIKEIQTSILVDNKNFLALNKPSGLAVHGGSGIKLGIIEILRATYPKQKYLELVHRLDRDTSGILLVAKKSSILKELHALLRTGDIKKTYLALVAGHWPKNLKKIDAPLAKNNLQSGERIVRIHETGKASITQFRPLRYFSDTTLIEAIPITGRTHQIRVHAQKAKHPIIGDEKYGNKITNKKLKEAFNCNRLFLHASQLQFTLPSTHEKFMLEAPLPKTLQNVLSRLDQK